MHPGSEYGLLSRVAAHLEDRADLDLRVAAFPPPTSSPPDGLEMMTAFFLEEV